jgi:hypothetical protein
MSGELLVSTPLASYLTTGANAAMHDIRHPMPVCNLFGFFGRVRCRSDFPSVAGFFVHRGACSLRFPSPSTSGPNRRNGVTHFGVAIPAKPSYEQFRARRLAQPSRDSLQSSPSCRSTDTATQMTVFVPSRFDGMDGRATNVSRPEPSPCPIVKRYRTSETPQSKIAIGSARFDETLLL